MHDGERWNLGSGSSRESRVDFLWRAVGIVHFGHPVFNPQGGDPDWCVKDAGGGRPPSDDVLVRCSTREAWDLIGGAGANGYRFHQDYLGRLGGDQNVYPPPVPAGAGAGLPPDPNRPRLPDARGLVAQINAERPELMAQSCPNGLKYVNNPWLDYVVDRLRQTDPRWGYNAKPTRSERDNNGVPGDRGRRRTGLLLRQRCRAGLRPGLPGRHPREPLRHAWPDVAGLHRRGAGPLDGRRPLLSARTPR